MSTNAINATVVVIIEKLRRCLTRKIHQPSNLLSQDGFLVISCFICKQASENIDFIDKLCLIWPNKCYRYASEIISLYRYRCEGWNCCCASLDWFIYYFLYMLFSIVSRIEQEQWGSFPAGVRLEFRFTEPLFIA